ncbi:MAG: type VI secretion system Vgr family protein [Bryobacteraceae bacterium]
MPDRFTQEGRLIAIDTPLGADRLLLRSFSGTETISQLFHFQLDLASEDDGISFDDVVGQKVRVRLLLADQRTERYFSGHVSRFTQLPGEGRLARYQAEMVPWLWFLTRTTDCRIFQNKTVPEIVQTVFGDFGFQDFELQLQGSYEPWEYCVQYRETACNFVMRLLEQEGIFFFFRHERDKHVMVLADSPSANRPCPNQASVRYETVAGPGYDRAEDVVLRYRRHEELRPGKCALTEYYFETPSTDLSGTVESRFDQGGNHRFEVFDYPGEYEKRSQAEPSVKLRMEEQEVPHVVIRGDGTCRSFASGFRFGLTEHHRREWNEQHLLVSVTHSGHSGSFYGDSGGGESYSNTFIAIPYDVQFRPPRLTPKRLVHGPQTAVVTGPSGEEIYVDRYGRVKVQFYWDRLGRHDENTSCWIRVSQPWSGKNWGAISIPRIGQEVIVDFLEGDPDRPIITGRVYNAEQMPPYELPANQTQSGIKSRSSKGGGGYNELRMEDKKDAEMFTIHAQKDLETFVLNDSREAIGRNRELNVEGNQTEVVAGDKHSTVGGELRQDVGGDLSLAVGGARDEKAGTKFAVEAGQEIHLKAGMKVIIEAGAQLSLKGPGGFVDIGPAGVSIQGTMVLINSGGSAGSGSGASPKKPKSKGIIKLADKK